MLYFDFMLVVWGTGEVGLLPVQLGLRGRQVAGVRLHLLLHLLRLSRGRGKVCAVQLASGLHLVLRGGIQGGRVSRGAVLRGGGGGGEVAGAGLLPGLPPARSGAEPLRGGGGQRQQTCDKIRLHIMS